MSSIRQRDWMELARHLVASTPNSCLGLMQAGPRADERVSIAFAQQMTERLNTRTLLLRPAAQPRRTVQNAPANRLESLAADLDVAHWELPVRRGELTAIPMSHLAELAKWKQRYRMIVIDLQQLLGPWAGSVGRLCDQVWLLHRPDAVACRRSATRLERLAAVGVPVEGRIRLCFDPAAGDPATPRLSPTGRAA